jgi:membrane associated rhomboid family serine protease
MINITPAIKNIMIINVLVYLCQVSITAADITGWGGLHYFTSDNFKPHQFLTYMFLHDNRPGQISHLLFNMLGLLIFGSKIENYIGSQRFLVLYFVSGLAAAVLTMLTVPFSAQVFAASAEGKKILLDYNAPVEALIHSVKMNYQMVGASGCVMGIMAAFAYLFPNTQMFSFLIPFPIKAKYIVLIYVLGDLFGGIHRIPGDNVAHFAHLGGALAGFLLIYYWNKTNRKTFY